MVNAKINSHDIIKGVGAGLCLLDRNFRILWVNRVQADWFGTLQNICGKHCYKVFEHRNHICKGCPTLKAFKTGTVCSATKIGFTKDGQTHYYQLTVSPIKDKHRKVVQALEVSEDITERVKQERKKNRIIDKLKRSLERLLSANRRLKKDTGRLRWVSRVTKKLKDKIYKKYHDKINELNIAKEELHGIIKINNAFSLTSDSKKIINLIAMLTCKIMHTDACTIRLIDEKRNILTIEGGWGFGKNYLSLTPLKLGESISGKVAKIGRPIVIDNLCQDSQIKYPEIVEREGLVSVVAMPMTVKNQILGVITTYTRNHRHFTEEETKPLAIFASQAAIAIQEARLYDDLHINYFNTMHSLVLAMEARDPYTRGHADRVTRYSIEIAQALDLPEHDIEILRYAGEVHDVGKIAISDLILNKPGKLTPAERAVIQMHPSRGAEMLEPLQFLKPAIPLVRHHHERYDGKGYPDGLDRERIPLMARIMACADAFDAMTSDRPYRKCRMSMEEALVEIRDNMGTQFDPRIAKVFIRIIKKI